MRLGEKILDKLAREIGDETVIETLVDLKPVFTSENDPFVQIVYDVCKVERMRNGFPRALPYLTDGSVLQKLYNDAPTVILGPGNLRWPTKLMSFAILTNWNRQ